MKSRLSGSKTTLLTYIAVNDFVMYVLSVFETPTFMLMKMGPGLYRNYKQSLRPHGRPKHRWEANNKMHVKEIGCKSIEWIQVTQNRVHW
jgi:hypothetical protein